MLTAHLPAGYCLARTLRSKVPLLLPAVLLGSMLPDFDMLFFHFVDHGAIHHHRYWVHIPFFWAVVAALAVPVLAWFGQMMAGLAFFAAIFLHLLLDSIGGGIMWLYPFDDTLYELVTVPATRSHWIWSFILHWTFLAEIAVWIAAAILLLTRRRTPQPA